MINMGLAFSSFPFSSSSHVSNSFSFNANFMLSQFDHGIRESQKDLATIGNETSFFLRPRFESQPTPRRPSRVAINNSDSLALEQFLVDAKTKEKRMRRRSAASQTTKTS